MPAVQMIDEVVNERPAKAGAVRGLAARPVHDETISPNGTVKADRTAVVDENHSNIRAGGRTFKDSTEKLLAKMEKEEQDEPKIPAHDEGDADEDEPDDAGEADGDADDDAGDDEGDAGDDEGDDAAAEGDGEEGDADEGEDPTAALTETAQRLEARNRELVSELETAHKTPKAQRTERETALIAAESSYYDEGSIPALRKFLSVIVGTAADSKEVDAELAGIYTDLTARELGVTLDQNQQALRDNARTRLLLARDKREKVEADKKPVPDNSAEAVNYGEATKHVDTLLSTKGQSGTSPADEYPMLMTLAEDLDGFKPGELIARAIRQEIMTGTLDPKKHSDIEMVRHVAPKIEKHYAGVALKIKAKLKKPDTTTPSGKPKVAVEARTEQRRSTGAPTITTTTASRAPAKNPKVEKQKAKTTTEKQRKDFPSDAAWKDHLLNKHFSS